METNCGSRVDRFPFDQEIDKQDNTLAERLGLLDYDKKYDHGYFDFLTQLLVDLLTQYAGKLLFKNNNLFF